MWERRPASYAQRVAMVAAALLAAFWPAWCTPGRGAEEERSVPSKASASHDGLKLLATMTPGRITEGEEFKLAATLENAGAQPLKLFSQKSKQLSGIHWRIRSASGQSFAIYRMPGQRVAGTGIQGEIVVLSPGERRTYETTVRLVTTTFLGIDRGSDPLPLQAGSYHISCSYDQATNLLPFMRSLNSRVEQRPVEGLWTGSLQSEEMGLTVMPSGKPRLRIYAAHDPNEGEPYLLQVEIENATDENVSLRGAFVVNLVSGKVRYGPGGRPVAQARKPVDLSVPAHGDRKLDIDLTHVAFTDSWNRDDRSARGFYEAVWTGATTKLWLEFTGEDGAPPLRSNEIGRIVRNREIAAIPGLCLKARARPVDDGSWPLVEVCITNEGEAPMRIQNRLAFPTDIIFDLRNAPKGAQRAKPRLVQSRHSPDSNAMVPDGLWWESRGFEHPEPLWRDDFDILQPGRSVRRIFDLSYLLGGKAAPGRYELTVFWRGFESGRRFDLEGPPATVGVLVSEPVTIEIPSPGKRGEDRGATE